MKRLTPILMVAGLVLLIIIIVIILSVQNSQNEVENQTGNSIPQENEEVGSNTFEPDDTFPSPIPGEWYEHRGLKFRLPPGWKPETSSADAKVVIAQPDNAISLFSLPRLLINIDKPKTDPTYIPFQQRYQNHTLDKEISGYNDEITAAYRSTHPYTSETGIEEGRDIQEIVTVLQFDDQEFRLHFQYDSRNQQPQIEETLTSILESLQYQ